MTGPYKTLDLACAALVKGTSCSKPPCKCIHADVALASPAIADFKHVALLSVENSGPPDDAHPALELATGWYVTADGIPSGSGGIGDFTEVRHDLQFDPAVTNLEPGAMPTIQLWLADATSVSHPDPATGRGEGIFAPSSVQMISFFCVRTATTPACLGPLDGDLVAANAAGKLTAGPKAGRLALSPKNEITFDPHDSLTLGADDLAGTYGVSFP